jgi:hypothetical protein
MVDTIALAILIIQTERETGLRGKKPSYACLAWTRDGRAIIIRDTLEFTNKLQAAKFSSLVLPFYLTLVPRDGMLP